MSAPRDEYESLEQVIDDAEAMPEGRRALAYRQLAAGVHMADGLFPEDLDGPTVIARLEALEERWRATGQRWIVDHAIRVCVHWGVPPPGWVLDGLRPPPKRELVGAWRRWLRHWIVERARAGRPELSGRALRAELAKVLPERLRVSERRLWD